MLTLTIRHAAPMPLEATLRLRKAWRRTRQRGSVQRLWKDHVTASVRAVEIPDGKHGWHPHLHVLVLSTVWSDDDMKIVRDTWKAMVTRELGAECCPDDEHGAYWSRGGDDTYLAKLGLEVTGAAKKNSAWMHADTANERYSVARRVFAHDERARIFAQGDRARARFREYEAATKGCRAIELDDRAASLARVGETLRLAGEAGASGDAGVHAPVYEIPMTGILETVLGPLSLMRALGVLERDDRSIFSDVLEVAARAPPHAGEAAVRSWLDEQIAVRFAAWPRNATGHFCATS